MASVHLTMARVQALQFDPDGPIRQIVWDAGLPGFGVRVQPAGTKSFVVLYRIGDRKRLVKIGDVRDFKKIEQARDAAREARRTVRLQDRDPIPARSRKIENVNDLATAWLAYLKQKGCKDSYINDAKNRLNLHVLPDIGRLRPKDVTAVHVDRIHRRLTKAGKRMTANRCVALVQAIFSYAARPAIRAVDPNEPNPAKGVERNPEKARKVFVWPSEMPALLEAIDAEADPYMQAFFLLAILTGARRGELLGLKWADADTENRRLIFRDTKNREDHTLSISQPAADLLDALPRQEGNPYVLCGHIIGQPIVNPDKPWRRIRERAGLPDLHIHDLRRTFGSWLATAGRTTQQIGKALGHKSSITARVYAEIAEQAKSDLADDMAALVDAARRTT